MENCNCNADSQHNLLNTAKCGILGDDKNGGKATSNLCGTPPAISSGASPNSAKTKTLYLK